MLGPMLEARFRADPSNHRTGRGEAGALDEAFCVLRNFNQVCKLAGKLEHRGAYEEMTRPSKLKFHVGQVLQHAARGQCTVYGWGLSDLEAVPLLRRRCAREAARDHGGAPMALGPRGPRPADHAQRRRRGAQRAVLPRDLQGRAALVRARERSRRRRADRRDARADAVHELLLRPDRRAAGRRRRREGRPVPAQPAPPRYPEDAALLNDSLKTSTFTPCASARSSRARAASAH